MLVDGDRRRARFDSRSRAELNADASLILVCEAKLMFAAIFECFD